MRHIATPAENRLWQKLRRHQLLGLKFRRQHPVDRFIVDFYCAEASLIVEIDGPTHDYTAEADALRQRCIESLGLTVLRFSNQDIVSNLEGVLHTICAHAGRDPDSG
ncbi:MAG: endonuclease domain-containing protein [Armatimonadetes bacterium]|nr:endonuclease domain-containing protein [Armatimonadota bacterium]